MARACCRWGPAESNSITVAARETATAAAAAGTEAGALAPCMRTQSGEAAAVARTTKH